jgi:hypothetical protein
MRQCSLPPLLLGEGPGVRAYKFMELAFLPSLFILKREGEVNSYVLLRC